MPWAVRLEYDSYETAHREFDWEIPADYNIAHDLLRKHDDQTTPALYQTTATGTTDRTFSFAELDARSNQLATGLERHGIGAGDRVAVVVPPKAANPLTHLACWKLAAISVPLTVLFGESALAYRLQDSGSKVVVADSSVTDTILSVKDNLPDLETIIEVDGHSTDTVPFTEIGDDAPPDRNLHPTTPNTPAVLLYTSGSTGPPKGVLHSHGIWVGHCPAFFMYFEHAVDEGVFWTPADWAWIGALGDLVFPAWHHGRPVVGSPLGKFDPNTAYEILESYRVTHAFLPPTAIRMMMDVPSADYDLSLVAICSGGEPLTPEILSWAADELDGVVVNEIYGQTEANLLVTNCRRWFDARPGSMGKPVPGHTVAIIDPATGEEQPPGEDGVIAVRRDNDPVVFEAYWNDPDKTRSTTIDGWHLTGDLGYRDTHGYFWFKARDDDLIITAGYRVGPGEVEQALLAHHAVQQAGVIGIPDDVRGEIIKAFVQTTPGIRETSALREELQEFVKHHLAAHEYPREIEFLPELPQTTTGKIKRSALRDHP